MRRNQAGYVLVGLALTVAACSDEDDGNTSEGGSEASGGGPSTGSGGSAGGGTQECSVQLACTPDCADVGCGEVDSSFDSAGCPRDFCQTDDDCKSDERCLLEVAGGGQGGATPICVPMISSCFEDDGECVCGGGLICSGYCVPQ